MRERPAVAVVVPALNEADNIGDLLADCAAQTLPAAEVVVVDAGSDDGTLAVARAAMAALPSLRVVEAPGATPGRGRNEGVRATGSPLVVTLDAGSRIGPNFLAELTRPVVEDGRRVAVGVAAGDARTAFEEAAAWFTLRAFKPPAAAGPLTATFLPAGRNGYCFTREAWDSAGGYPPDLAWGEDKLFLRRLREHGRELNVVETAVVRWRPRRSLGELYRQYRGYGRGDALARLDRQNELVTAAVYGLGAGLALRAARGDRLAGAALAAGFAAYLSLFVTAARRDLRDGRALAWVPAIRLVVDVAKLHGFAEGSLASLRRPR